MFSSKKKLIVSGCSYTEDCYNFPVWPTVLAEKLDMQVVNLAHSGNGNEFIYNTLMDYIICQNKKNIGLVIAMWSEFQRMDFQMSDKITWKNIHTMRDNKYSWKNSIRDKFVKEAIHEVFARTQKSIRLFYTFQEVMKNKNIKYLQIVGTYPEPNAGTGRMAGAKNLLNSEYQDHIDESKFIGWPIFQDIGGFTVDDFLIEHDPKRQKNIIDGTLNEAMHPTDNHPNKLGHEQIANLIYDYYVENIK